MSDLVKTQNNTPKSQLVNPQKRKQKENLAPQTDSKPEIDLDDQLSDMAIAAADAPFAKAYQVYEQRFANNVRDFQAYVKSSQQKVKNLLKDAIYEAHGVKESDLYGDGKDE